MMTRQARDWEKMSANHASVNGLSGTCKELWKLNSKQINKQQLKGKMAKSHEQAFHWEDIQMENKHITINFTLLAIR